jgi:ABC-type multidrug transport system permease subunit
VLNFSARLKLPSPLLVEERTRRVDSLLHAFDLGKCADTFIGGDSLKGISGGEKKRLSIAVEVISNPKLLFLDEPTSGLDATSAYRIMALLRLLADGGTTIITTLHQPRPSIANGIDRFLVLSSGHQVYFGPMRPMLDHFARLGFTLPVGENPLDYMLDLINTDPEFSGLGEDSLKTTADLLNIQLRPNSTFAMEALPSALAPGQSRAELAAELALKYCESTDAVEYLKPLPEDELVDAIKTGKWGFKSKWITRYFVVVQREFLQKMRNPQVMISQLFAALLMGTLMGSFYYNTTPTSYLLVNNALAFCLMFSVFFSFPLVLFFPSERHIFLRDFSQGIIGSSEYYIGLVTSDFPTSILASTMFATVFYFMVGLRAEAFGVFLGIMILGSMCGASMLLAVGAFAPDVATANSLVSIFFLFCMFLNGYFSTGAPAWVWVSTINYLRFLTYAAFENQWANYTLNCTVPSECLLNDGNLILAAIGVDTGVSVGIWCLYALIVFLVMHTIGFIAVAFMYNGRLQTWIKSCQKDQNCEKKSTKMDIALGLSEESFDRQAVEL